MKVDKIVDLSMSIERGMRLFPGIPEPVLTRVRTHEANGLQVSKLEAVVHAGTHVDAPRHVLSSGATIGNTGLDRLVGEGLIVNLKHQVPGSVICEADLLEYAGAIKEHDIVVLNTGYQAYSDPQKYRTLAPEAAHWLVNKRIKCLAVDIPSLDPINRTGGRASPQTHPAHHIILGAGIPLVECLANLDTVQGRVFIACLPLKLPESDAAPARVVALTFSGT
jgi:kynurenine formamidase